MSVPPPMSCHIAGAGGSEQRDQTQGQQHLGDEGDRLFDPSNQPGRGRSHRHAGGERQQDANDDDACDRAEGQLQGSSGDSLEHQYFERHDDNGRQRKNGHQSERVVCVATGLDLPHRQQRWHRGNGQDDQSPLHGLWKVEEQREQHGDGRHDHEHREQRPRQQAGAPNQVRQIAGSSS